MTIFSADKIVTENKVKENHVLMVKDGKITRIISDTDIDNGEEKKDFKDKIIIPGFIDIHTHGGGGYRPEDGIEALINWSFFKADHGVTGFLPTTPTVSRSRMDQVGSFVKKAQKRKGGPKNILGWHLEGPFFTDSSKIGAQDSSYTRNSFTSEYQDLIKKYGDLIKYCSIDPRVQDEQKIISYCRDLDIKMGAGHTEISHQEFTEKKELYTAVIHTFNGMKGLHHRNPGLALTACMDDQLFAEIICDGLHVIFPMLKLFFRLKNLKKAILVTDAMVAAGQPRGKVTTWGKRKVKIDDQGRALLEDGTLAGSTLTMDRAYQNTVNKLNLSLVEASWAASLNPAVMLGIEDSKGSIAVGKDADFLVVDENLQIQATYLQGEKIS